MNICALCCQYEYATAGQNKVNNQYIWHSDHFLLFSSHVLQGMKTDDKWLLAMHLLRWVSLLLQVHKLWSLISSADFYHISCQNIQLQVKTSKLSLFGMQTIFIFCFFFLVMCSRRITCYECTFWGECHCFFKFISSEVLI